MNQMTWRKNQPWHQSKAETRHQQERVWDVGKAGSLQKGGFKMHLKGFKAKRG